MDRRAFVGGMAATTLAATASASPISPNDQAIIKAIERQRGLWTELEAIEGDFDWEFLEQHKKQFGSILRSTGWTIANTPSNTIVGIKAKAEWLSWPVNFNDGELTPACSNGKALISMLADIERIG